ncbi:MAG: EAL domain-containing protein [Xanthomonadales bacterium]|nr:EAL domain-containing protein [Xanthomonadales bacterium]
MADLLVVEQSSTLANLLQRTLQAGGFNRVEISSDMDNAVGRLGKDAFEGVVIGVPQRGVSDLRGLLKKLNGDSSALVLVSHQKHPQLERFARNRDRCEILPWQRFGRIPRVLAGMLPASAGQDEEAPEVDARSVRVLFIDDSRSSRYAYGQILKELGFPLTTAGTVEEAREKAAEGGFDLIISDYYLPDGTGAELLQHFSSHPPTAKASLAAITGTYRETIIKECIDAGATECMFKNEAKELFIARVSAMARVIESQRVVEAERQRLDGILASVGDGVYGVDSEGVITFFNSTGAAILGFGSSEELIGRPADEVIHAGEEDEQRLAVMRKAYLSGDRQSGFETVFTHVSGRLIPVECTIFPLAIQSRRRGSVVVFRDISERKTVEQLRWEVTHDPVTGLANRRHFGQKLDHAINRLRDEGGHGALLYIDIDRFGDIVRAIGESPSEQLLADVAGRLATLLRQNDVIARLGGDHFALLLTGIQLPNVFTVADTFRGLVGEVSYKDGEVERAVECSVGVIILSGGTPSAEYALEQGRIACDTAKKKGRDQTHIYIAEEDAKTVEALETGWTERFKEATREDRFVFLAQPIHPIGSVPEAFTQPPGETMRAAASEEGEFLYELLLRMVGKDGRWVSPGVFVPLAERVNMAQEIDLWVVRRAARILDDYSDHPARICFTINLSNVTLQDPGSLKLVREAVEQYRSVADRLIFEVTETAELASLHSARKMMMDLKKLGCRFALDDFGTGFSSFSHLKHLPVDFIKIDGMFVQSMSSDDVDRTMVNSITSMAHALGLSTIAEHVNTESTLKSARQAGVDFVQGNFLGEPVALDNLRLDELAANS